jgi:glycosyltransferase involved in cell wall biosynthesis
MINENYFINKKNFFGKVNHKKVLSYIHDSDIFIFASSAETFGITLLEGMALGMPIVCSSKSSLPEILKDGGIYFNPNNDYELANQIERFIKDKKFRKKKSKKAFNISLGYNWKNNVEQFCNLVNKLSK